MFSSVFFCLDFMVSARNLRIFPLPVWLGIFFIFEDDIILGFESFVLIGCITSQGAVSFHVYNLIATVIWASIYVMKSYSYQS